MTKLKGKKVLIVGLGRTGHSAAKYLHAQGAKVTVTDTKHKADFTNVLKDLEPLKLVYEFGKSSEKVFLSHDLIVLSPGVPRALPEIQAAIKAGIPITNDLELARDAIKVPIIAVTGTNGKTTTTTMITEMLKNDGKTVFTGGNIGVPVLDVLNLGLNPDCVVLEVSSFQCESFTNFKADVTVLTNLEPDHLDRYPSIEDYYNAKRLIIQNSDESSTLILNMDNPASAKWAEGYKGKLLYFSKRDPLTIDGGISEKFKGTYLKRPKIISKISGRETTFDILGCRLPGDHNRENFMAAISAALCVGCSQTAIQKTIMEFRGVPHRLEFVRRKDGVTIFNDSKGTNVASVLRSIGSFNAPIILIAGGRDKDQDFGPLIDPVKKKVKNLILLGEAKEKINRTLGDFSETFLVGTFEEAVLLSFQKSRNGDVILFSPACASYDMFKNFEERGEYFRKLVLQL